MYLGHIGIHHFESEQQAIGHIVFQHVLPVLALIFVVGLAVYLIKYRSQADESETKEEE